MANKQVLYELVTDHGYKRNKEENASAPCYTKKYFFETKQYKYHFSVVFDFREEKENKICVYLFSHKNQKYISMKNYTIFREAEKLINEFKEMGYQVFLIDYKD